MPIYEYKCNQCGSVTEVIQKVTEAPLTLCQECGGRLRKLVSSPAIQFKGTGWYVTDYARSGKNGTDKKKQAKKNTAPDKKDGAAEKESDKKKPEDKKESSPPKPTN